MAMRRVTVTVDGGLLDEVAAEVAAGPADSVSAWVADAMAQRRERDLRLGELAALIADYEAEHGVISNDELAAQAQADRDKAALARAGIRSAG